LFIKTSAASVAVQIGIVVRHEALILNSYNKYNSSSKKIGYDYFAKNKPKPKELHHETLPTFE